MFPALPNLPMRKRRASYRKLRLEVLELRTLLSASTGEAVPYHVAAASGVVAPLATTAPTGYSPAQIRAAYGFDQIAFTAANGTIPGDGRGTTIAIVDAYDDPRIANDLHQFSVQYGLPEANFTKVNQYGGTTYPATNSLWIAEIALDVEWAHAIAPMASILLVEANSASFNDLLTAVDYARHVPGVVAVSMSWGGGDIPYEAGWDGYFTTPSGHNGITFLAASGDTGAPVSYPAISPNVVAVGGTSLSLNAQGGYISEWGWSGSGGGISIYEAQPAYQRSLVTQNSVYRTNPDVAYDSDPSTGFSVYDTYNNPISSPWSRWGGTSIAAPQWAALIAIADQGRMLAGSGTLDGPTQTLPLLYSVSSADFHDITAGTSTGRPRYSANYGYDLVTGRGSPVANLLVADLVGGVVASVPNDPPVISDIVVAASPPQNGILESNKRGVISWAVDGSAMVASKSLTVDGCPASATFGPYGPYSGNVYYFSGVFGPLSAGTHNYQIQVTDTYGQTAVCSGSFVVAAAAGPAVSDVVVVEAIRRNGILASNEQGLITWAAASQLEIKSRSLAIDNVAISPTNGPYGPSSGVYYFSAQFGPLAAGTHTYRIEVTDVNGQTGVLVGSFVVAAVPKPAISTVVVAEAKATNGVLESDEQGVITWAVTPTNPVASKSLHIDGFPVAAMYGPYGPYAGGAYYYSGVYGPLAASNHTFIIQVTDTAGATSRYLGNFTVSVPASKQSPQRNSLSSTLAAIEAAAIRLQQEIEHLSLVQPAAPAINADTSPTADAALRQTTVAENEADDLDDKWPADVSADNESMPSAENHCAVAPRVELLDAIIAELTTEDAATGSDWLAELTLA